MTTNHNQRYTVYSYKPKGISLTVDII